VAGCCSCLPVDDDDDDDDVIRTCAGVLVRRQKLPKDDVGDNYTWKDLNNGVNVTAYGKVFHLYDCDKFTRVRQQSISIV